jgi:hypothetical protein
MAFAIKHNAIENPPSKKLLNSPPVYPKRTGLSNRKSVWILDKSIGLRNIMANKNF